MLAAHWGQPACHLSDSRVLIQVGFYVDRDHLAEQDLKAQDDLRDAERRFRSWLRRYAHVVGQGNADYGWSAEEVPDLVNLSSGAQIQTLLFGGFQSSRDVMKTPTKVEAEGGMKPHMVKPQLATVCPRELLILRPMGMGVAVPVAQRSHLVVGTPVHGREPKAWGARREEAIVLPAYMCVWI